MLRKEWTLEDSLRDHQQVSLTVRWTFVLFQHSINIGSEVEGGQEKQWHGSPHLGASWSCFAEVSGTVERNILNITILSTYSQTPVTRQTTTEMIVPLYICNLPTCAIEWHGEGAVQIQVNSKQTSGGFAIKHLKTVKSYQQAVQVYILFILCCWARLKTCWTDLSVLMNAEKAGSGGGQKPTALHMDGNRIGSLAPLWVLDVGRVHRWNRVWSHCESPRASRASSLC